MSSFTEALTTTDLNDGTFKVQKAFTYYIGSENSNDSITVPEGFVFDGFSIPKFARWLLPKIQKRGNQAAALHDFATEENKRTWKNCADIFLEAMGVLRVSAWRRYLMYISVIGYGYFRKPNPQ